MTDTLAMAKWEGVLHPHQDFELRISVSEVNRPRMWVEKSGKTEAAMLTFYPDISVNSVGNRCTVKILVDCSMSMKSKWKGMFFIAASPYLSKCDTKLEFIEVKKETSRIKSSYFIKNFYFQTLFNK